MRARLALVALTTVCGFFVLPATAHAAGGVLSCAGLTGTFTDTFDPIYDTEEIVAGHLSLRAEGTCLLDGKQVTASVTGEGRSIFGGVCGALAFGGNMDGQLPAVDPTESGTL